MKTRLHVIAIRTGSASASAPWKFPVNASEIALIPFLAVGDSLRSGYRRASEELLQVGR